MVGDVVGVAGKGVIGVDVPAQRLGDQPGADGKIFIATVLPGPCFDRRRRDVRGGCRGRTGLVVLDRVQGVAP
jgi:hypothetical protein